MCVGNVLESDGHDQSDINLPGNQLQLLQDATDLAISECDQYSLWYCVKYKSAATIQGRMQDSDKGVSA